MGTQDWHYSPSRKARPAPYHIQWVGVLWRPQGVEFGDGRPLGWRPFRDPRRSRELRRPWQAGDSASMAAQGARVAMAEPGIREDIRRRPLWLEHYYYPPKEFIGESRGSIRLLYRRSGHLRVLWRRGHLRAFWRHGHLRVLWRHGYLRALWKDWPRSGLWRALSRSGLWRRRNNITLSRSWHWRMLWRRRHSIALSMGCGRWWAWVTGGRQRAWVSGGLRVQRPAGLPRELPAGLPHHELPVGGSEPRMATGLVRAADGGWLEWAGSRKLDGRMVLARAQTLPRHRKTHSRHGYTRLTACL